jgi:16S rRNA processing protein RimM
MMARSPYDPETLPIGVLGRPHGLHGEIVLRPHNPASADLARVSTLILDHADADARDERRVWGIRRFSGNWLVRFEGIDSPEAAAPLTNLGVRVRRSALPPPVDGEFFVEDVIGCAVRTEDDRALGVVDDVFWNGAHDVMVVVGDGDAAGDVKDEGEKETLIPLVPAFVRAVDIAGRAVLVAWTENG